MDTRELSIAYTRHRYLFPRCSFEIPARSGRERELEPGRMICAFPVNGIFDLFFMKGKIATLSEVVRIIENPGIKMAEVRGERRVRIISVRRFEFAEYDEIVTGHCDGQEDAVDRLRKKAQQFVFLINIKESDRLIYLMNFLSGLSDMTDFIAHYFVIDNGKKAKLYRITDPCERASVLEHYLDGMISRISRSGKR